MHELLLSLGYTGLDEELYSFTGNYYAVLFHGAYLIEDTSMEVKLQILPPEEKKKMEIILNTRREQATRKKKEQEYKREMQELS